MHHKFELSSLLRTLLAFPHIPSYTYKPLHGPPDAIRLVLLQPAPFISSPISCRIIETSWGHERTSSSPTVNHKNGRTTSSPQKGYTALSYTWGSSTQKTHIEIDGRPFHITSNLHTALQHLRSQRKEVRIWADSLCINQNDVEERNLHVSQMREIYSAANETTIFLGKATPGSDALLSAIRDASAEMGMATTKNATVKSLVKTSEIKKSELMEEASRILWRGYWKRIWIFQEIVVSENLWVQCGNMKVPWEDFCQAVIALLMEEKVFGGGYGNEAKRRLEDVYWERRAWRAARGMRQKSPGWDMRGQEEEGRMGVLDLLVTKRASEASDERDMVFAVSGCALLKKGTRPLDITYEKSAVRVYMDTVKYLLEHDRSYEVLSHAGDFQATSTSPPIPSWVPDWRIPSPYKIKIVDWITPSHSSSTIVKRNHVCLEKHSVLVCVGYKFDTIQSISPNTSEIKPAAGSIGRVIWDDKWRRRKLIEHGVLSDLGTRLGTVASLVSRSHPITHGRKMARLKGGALALVPSEAREGDVVGVFVGSAAPFVLRRIEKKGIDDWDEIEDDALRGLKKKDIEGGVSKVAHYGFVGECFVDGLMGGEIGQLKKSMAFILH